MIKQKVVTVNIYTGDASKGGNKVREVELETVNKYLDDGFIIVDRFTSTTNSAFNINITFILQKETE